MIREVSAEAFAALYKEHIMRDFAPEERRPLFAIERLYRKGRYTCQVLGEDGALQAYACFIQAEGVGGVLLDYFAVAPEMRGSGIGSAFLVELQAAWPVDGILIECEMPEDAKDEEDAETRRRRIAFYTRLGAVMTDYGWHAFSVEYNLLWLPIRKQLDAVEVGEMIARLYAATSPAWILRLQTRVYRLTE